MTQKILFVVTSTDKFGTTGEPTGMHYEEMTTPYYYFTERELEVEFASRDGGKTPLDPGSIDTDVQSVAEFKEDKSALNKLHNAKKTSEVSADDYVGVYLPGGHGTMWDLPEDDNLRTLLETFWAQGKPVGAVCHGPAGLVKVTDQNGDPIVKGRTVNCFTDAEEKHIEKDGDMPFLLETRLKELGGRFENAGIFEACSVRDGQLITGQNPPSALGVAEKIYDALKELSLLDKQAA